MRKFHSPVNLKAAADAAVHTVAVDVTLAELVQAHALAVLTCAETAGSIQSDAPELKIP
jgi:hypothetical protein